MSERNNDLLSRVTVIRSSRRTVSLQVLPDGRLICRAPRFMPRAQLLAFLQSKEGWIEATLKKLASRPSPAEAVPLTDAEYRELVARAKTVIPERTAYFAKLVGVTYGNITIRCQKTRWGSCSARGNLNFNCLLLLAPPEVLDSVIVHELCHRKEMNHSARFYREVYRVLPDYDLRHRWLKENGAALLARAAARQE